jgi:hypothetical protein
LGFQARRRAAVRVSPIRIKPPPINRADVVTDVPVLGSTAPGTNVTTTAEDAAGPDVTGPADAAFVLVGAAPAAVDVGAIVVVDAVVVGAAVVVAARVVVVVVGATVVVVVVGAMVVVVVVGATVVVVVSGGHSNVAGRSSVIELPLTTIPLRSSLRHSELTTTVTDEVLASMGPIVKGP